MSSCRRMSDDDVLKMEERDGIKHGLMFLGVSLLYMSREEGLAGSDGGVMMGAWARQGQSQRFKASGVASILVIWIHEYNSMSIRGIILQLCSVLGRL